MTRGHSSCHPVHVHLPQGVTTCMTCPPLHAMPYPTRGVFSPPTPRTPAPWSAMARTIPTSAASSWCSTPQATHAPHHHHPPPAPQPPPPDHRLPPPPPPAPQLSPSPTTCVMPPRPHHSPPRRMACCPRPAPTPTASPYR